MHGNRNGRSGSVCERDVTLPVLQVTAYILVGNFSLQLVTTHIARFLPYKPKRRIGGLRRSSPRERHERHEVQRNICCTNVTTQLRVGMNT